MWSKLGTFIRRLLLNWVLQGIVKEAVKLIDTNALKERVTSVGYDLGKRVGEAIPGDMAEPFLAAFSRGFADGMESTGKQVEITSQEGKY